MTFMVAQDVGSAGILRFERAEAMHYNKDVKLC